MPYIKYAPVISLVSLGIGAWLGTQYERKSKLISNHHGNENDSLVNKVRETFTNTNSKILNVVNESNTSKSIKERIEELRKNHENSDNTVNALFHR